MLYLALAGATLLISGLAVATTLMGPDLKLPEFAAFQARDTALPLSGSASGPQARIAAPDLSTASLSEGVQAKAAPAKPASASPPPVASLPVSDSAAETERREAKLAAERRIAAERSAAAEAAAKKKLAAKLASLKLARVLLAAQSAQMPATAPEITVAGKAIANTPSPDAKAVSEPVTVAALEQPAVRSVAPTEAPVKPGAIVPRMPDAKPDLPQQVRSAKQEPTVTARKPVEAKPEQASPVLAYATPGTPEKDDDGVFSGIGKLFGNGKDGLPGAGSKVAVYDISAATVHMPDGTKLEAHSGIGHRMDNPKYAYVKNYGPTPPNVYKLRMRERRFHGVEAIRMLPLDHAAMKGRDGMLTHTRLLRRSIGSHGCVAFKDYDKFLKAFKTGKVKTLIVVPSMNKLPTYMAKYQKSRGA